MKLGTYCVVRVHIGMHVFGFICEGVYWFMVTRVRWGGGGGWGGTDEELTNILGVHTEQIDPQRLVF